LHGVTADFLGRRLLRRNIAGNEIRRHRRAALPHSTHNAFIPPARLPAAITACYRYRLTTDLIHVYSIRPDNSLTTSLLHHHEGRQTHPHQNIAGVSLHVIHLPTARGLFHCHPLQHGLWIFATSGGRDPAPAFTHAPPQLPPRRNTLLAPPAAPSLTLSLALQTLALSTAQH
jgi:hypothetical protein